MRTEPPVPAEVLGAVRRVLSADAERVDAPILQPLSLALELAGEAMRARLFVVQAEGAQEQCLRPDFTLAVVRRHIESGAASGRYVYEGAAFRAAPGTDRPEEFVQMGVEAFAPAGEPAEDADAEVAGLAWRAAIAGGRKDLTLRLGDVALFSAFIEGLKLPTALASRLKRVVGRPRLLAAELARAGHAAGDPPNGGGQLATLLSGLAESQAAAMLEEVWALAGVEPVGGRRPAEIAARLVRKTEAAAAPALSPAQAEAIEGFMAISGAPEAGLTQVRSLGRGKVLEAALEGWSRRLEALSQAVPEAQMRFAPALGHAFDYYDGLTFEVVSAALGADRPVAVGGRYDGLLTRLGGKPGRAVGGMVRPWRAWARGEA